MIAAGDARDATMLSPLKVGGPSTQDDLTRLLQLAGTPDSVESFARPDRVPLPTSDGQSQAQLPTPAAATRTQTCTSPLPQTCSSPLAQTSAAVHPAEHAAREQHAQQQQQPTRPQPAAPSSSVAAKARGRAAEDTQEATLTALLRGVAGAVTVAVLLSSSLLLLPAREAYRYAPPSESIIGVGGGGAPGSLQRIREHDLASLKDIEEPDDDAEASRRHVRASGGGAGGGGGAGRGGSVAGPSRPPGDGGAKVSDGGHHGGAHAHHGEPAASPHT